MLQGTKDRRPGFLISVTELRSETTSQKQQPASSFVANSEAGEKKGPYLSPRNPKFLLLFHHYYFLCDHNIPRNPLTTTTTTTPSVDLASQKTSMP